MPNRTALEDAPDAASLDETDQGEGRSEILAYWDSLGIPSQESLLARRLERALEDLDQRIDQNVRAGWEPYQFLDGPLSRCGSYTVALTLVAQDRTLSPSEFAELQGAGRRADSHGRKLSRTTMTTGGSTLQFAWSREEFPASFYAMDSHAEGFDSFYASRQEHVEDVVYQARVALDRYGPR